MVELLLALLTTLTGIPRTVDADLSAIAQRRAVEISCEGCFSHAGWIYGRDGEAEVIAWNRDADPVTRLALQWQGSPPHWAILTDPNLRYWGCAVAQADGATFGVCLFRSGPAVTTEPITKPGPAGSPLNVGGAESTSLPALLPNTAIPPNLVKSRHEMAPRDACRRGPAEPTEEVRHAASYMLYSRLWSSLSGSRLVCDALSPLAVKR